LVLASSHHPRFRLTQTNRIIIKKGRLTTNRGPPLNPAAVAATATSRNKDSRVWEPARAVDMRESPRMENLSVPEMEVLVASATLDATRHPNRGLLLPPGRLGQPKVRNVYLRTPN
jgi:hypothetical protein